MCDRIIVFASNSGRCVDVIRVPFPYPAQPSGAGLPPDGG